jgi:transglycosylase-like protein with SLT domain
MRFRARHRTLLLLLLLLTMLATGDRGIAASTGSQRGTLTPGGAVMLDHVAYAVDEAESSHGTDPRMWRAEPNGPQGRMQVTAAAAIDAGGGDRFDEQQNRALGRSYLARMYRRYGSWADAIAAYNWGPGRMDEWIGGGRSIEKFPASVAYYRSRVLASLGGVAAASGAANIPVGFAVIRRGVVHMQPRRPLADQRRRSGGPDEVELLYIKIMRATDPNAR